MNLLYYIIFVLALAFDFNLASLADSELKPIESITSSLLSQLRFKIRNVDNDLNQCALYWKGIYEILKSNDVETNASDDRDLIDQVDTRLLLKVSDMLKNRKTAYGPSSLSEFTDNCINIINNYRNNVATSNGQQKPSIDDVDINVNQTISTNQDLIIGELEEDNASMRKELNELKLNLLEKENEKIDLNKMNILVTEELIDFKDKLQNKINKLASNELELKQLKEKVSILEQDQISLRKEKEKCYHDLELDKSNNFLRNHNDIENAKIHAQRERDQCIDQLNKANELKNHCEIDLNEVQLTSKEERNKLNFANEVCKNLLVKEQKLSKIMSSELETFKQQKTGLEKDLRECNSFNKNANYYKSKAQANKEKLDRCERELVKLNERDLESKCWSEIEELKQVGIRMHLTIKRAQDERDECLRDTRYYKDKSIAFDDLTSKVKKYIKNGYDVYCSKWKITKNRDDDDSDSDDDDD